MDLPSVNNDPVEVDINIKLRYEFCRLPKAP